MKLALEAMEEWDNYLGNIDFTKEIAALRQAIAEAEKPIAVQHLHEWFRTGGMKPGQIRCISCGQWGQEQIEDEWVGLTLEEILGTYRGPDGSDYVDYARAIDAKLKEKNTCT